MSSDDLRRLALALPEVTEKTSYGTPAWYVGGKLFARIHDSGDSAVVRVADEGEKQALIAEDPAVFWTTPHYDGYAMVLVRTDLVAADVLAELLTDAWLSRATPAVRKRHPTIG
jgi:hypothetical protein